MVPYAHSFLGEANLVLLRDMVQIRGYTSSEDIPVGWNSTTNVQVKIGLLWQALAGANGTFIFTRRIPF